jgi:hypothetical protein
MHPNPVLRELGLGQADRAVIIHTDDIGMCQASLAALADLVDVRLISCGATMVPCPWFPQVAAYCRGHPSVDLGIHLTLTSEWDSYRWGPISTRDPALGLIDDEGYFFRRSEPVQERAGPEAVRVEMQAQVERALWPSRVADYEAFTSAELRDTVKSSGLFVIGYRALRDRLRSRAA